MNATYNQLTLGVHGLHALQLPEVCPAACSTVIQTVVCLVVSSGQG